MTTMVEQALGELAWVDTHKYQSPDIINEMIELIGHNNLH